MSEKRNTCCKCGKKRKQQYMKQTIEKAKNGRLKWVCVDECDITFYRGKESFSSNMRNFFKNFTPEKPN